MSRLPQRPSQGRADGGRSRPGRPAAQRWSRLGQHAQRPCTRHWPGLDLSHPRPALDLPQFGPVLLIDDDEFGRATLAQILRATGLGVLEAGNGREALARLARSPRPGLIVLDLVMPVLDGWQFLE